MRRTFFGELSVALNIDKQEVENYIAEKIGKD